MTLRSKTFSGIRWTTASSLIRTGLQLLQIGILARLLESADFGLMALVMAIMAFLQIFADMGVSTAIIHHQEIDQRQLSSLYWLNVGSSACLAVILVLAGPAIASFYGDERIPALLWISGATIIVSAIGQQIRVIAEKELRFSGLVRAEVTAVVVAVAVSVMIAFLGGGVYALVVGTLANAATMTLLLWIFFSRGWRPLWYFKPSEIRHFLGFGAYMIGNNLANTFNSQVDVLLGGRVLGASAIGLYSLPRELCLRLAGVFNPIAVRVGIPVMSKAQDDMSLLRSIYLKAIRMTASINFPFYMLLVFFAPEVVHILFGAKWEEAIPLLRILALWGLLRSTGNPVGMLLMARGRADLSFKWNLWMLFIYPPIIWMGSRFGVEGMALSMLLAGCMVFPANWYWLVRTLCQARFGEYLTQVIVPFAISVISGLIGYCGAYAFSTDFARLCAGVAAGGAAYIAMCMVFNRAWFDTMKELVVGWK